MMNQPNSNILLSLVQGDRGKEWASSRNGWKHTNEDACDWDGIECDKNKHVISILLEHTNFSGTIPQVLGVLSSLKTILMGNNKLYGTIPVSVAALPKLVYMDLSVNRITGTLPHFFSPDLRILNLGYNDLHGSIPKNFISGKGTLLELSLPQNRLSGSIPDSMMELTGLDKIELSNNLLHGTIPESVGKLSLLQHLHLNNNFLVGPIPHTLAKSSVTDGKMGDLLETIHLQDNQLSGTIPLTLEYLPKLREFIVHENKLTGQVPPNICSESINAFFFQGTPATPDRNFCHAISCPVNTVSLDGTDPCTSCNNQHYNPYMGQTRMCNTVVNQREVLKRFYESTSSGDYKKWNGDNNWEDDEVFLCDFSGVTCDKNFHVTEISLPGRGLTGTIPESLGFLEYLEKLDVSDNNLEGFLPSDLRWAPLEFLDISGNNIRGVVPPKICLKAGINANGIEGDYNCNNIACPAGTYSAIGRQDQRSAHRCLPCHHNNPEVLGYKSCRKTGFSSGAFGVFIAITTLAVAVGVFVVSRMKRKKNRMGNEEEMYQFEMQRPINGGLEADGVNESGGTIDDMDFASSSRRGRSTTRSIDRKAYSEIPSHRDRTSSAEVPYPEADAVSVRSYSSRKSALSEESSRDMWLDVPKIT